MKTRYARFLVNTIRVGISPVACSAKKSAKFAIGVLALLLAGPVLAQQILQPGEAVVTRFSGTETQTLPGGQQTVVIDPNGISASIIDLRSPARPPQGSHWIEKPQRTPITARQIGQVFGVTLDQGPNIYLAASSAFGLHRVPGNSDWMQGMWGAGGGPGTIYRLDRQSGYQPRPFVNITLNGRPNTGAALGNIAFDRWNQQLFVSDLETGMIHRIRASDGADLGYFDHGVQGRSAFTDFENKQRKSLQPIPFNPNSRARINDCPAGEFQFKPECWNFAQNGRRVWGLGVGRIASGGDTRLYYSVASSPDLGESGWSALPEDEKRNSVWSVRILSGGAFDPSDVRREFILPDFFISQQEAAQAGYSRPVTDISFPTCTDRPVMLIAERGGVRNLGLAASSPFATPHESRAIRYELHRDGSWRPVGRYDVGAYARFNEGPPQMYANCAGGIAFAPGYSQAWTLDPRQPDQFVWITGDSLCSPAGLCNDPSFLANTQPSAGDPTEVHGIQGQIESAYGELVPQGAYSTTPKPQQASYTTAAVGLDQAFMVDTDPMIEASGSVIYDELTRDDSTKIGDIAIYEFCQVQQVGFVPILAAPPLLIYEAGHLPQESHLRFASHSIQFSHYRYGSHWPLMSHNQWGSHFPAGSMKHFPIGSFQHFPPGSVHFPIGSVKHIPFGSVQHLPIGSLKHVPLGSLKHFPIGSLQHFPIGSINHLPIGSVKHAPINSIKHNVAISNLKGHGIIDSQKHQPAASLKHTPAISNLKGHGIIDSQKHQPAASLKHTPAISNLKGHGIIDSQKHQPAASLKHTPAISNLKGHGIIDSQKAQHQPVGSLKHTPAISNLKAHLPVDSQKAQHQPAGSLKHTPAISNIKQHQPVDSQKAQHQPIGSVKQHLPVGSVKQHLPVGSVKQHLPVGSVKQHLPVGSVKQHLPVGSIKIHQPVGSVKQHVPAGSIKIHQPVGSVKQHVPAGSVKQHVPAGSVKHAPAASAAKIPKDSK